MSEEKHTPGPWSAEDKIDDRGGWHDPRQRILITGPKGVLVANYTTEFMEYPDDDENAANARLIVAAPDMLEALKDCVAVIEAMIAIHGPDPAGASVIAMNKGDSAIAKATGG